MKAILCTGAPHSEVEKVFELLLQAGLAPAQPGRLGALTPQALQAQMLRSYELDLSAGSACLAQLRPGKMWGQLATDLFLANIHEPTWGWADHQTTVLMDFWHDFDPQVRLLLVYNSPQAYLALALDQQAPPSPHAVATALDDWARWNTVLLRHYHRHPDSCVLVNSQLVLEKSQIQIELLSTQWQIPELVSSPDIPSCQIGYRRLQAHLINQLIDPLHPALTLFQELETAALTVDTPAEDPAADATPSPHTVWAEWVQVRSNLAQLGDLADEKAALLHAHDDLQAEKAQLTQQIDSQQARLAEASQTMLANAEATELKQENELLLSQLHQVQEELEHYFLLYQELVKTQHAKATGFVTDFWRMHQPRELVISMQQDIVGNNWYTVETDSRWAGPAKMSTLRMPPVNPGNYTLELDIVDATNMNIVNELTVETLGQSHSVAVFYPRKRGRCPVICKVPLTVSHAHAQEPWEVRLCFTQTVCPADKGSVDIRHLAIRLRTLKLIKSS